MGAKSPGMVSGDSVKRRARGTRRPQWQRGVMNKGEQRYADHIDTLKAKGEG